ncbi:MAG: ABC transporter ATP-binding protein [Nitrososphaeria archaeon]
MAAAVDIVALVKVFGQTKAVNNLSLRISENEVFGLIGPNGAGKTTTLRIIATLLKPTSGTVKVFGYDVSSEPEKVRSLISYLPEESGAYNNLSGAEYLKFMASFYAKNEDEVNSIVEEGSSISGLGDRLRDKVKTYSKGMKRRLLVARALMIRPKLAILDEPTSGLDVFYAHNVRNIIRDYSRKYNVTVLLSSHNMLEVQYVCSKVALIDSGTVVEEGSPTGLMEKYGSSNLEDVFVKVSNIA